MGNIGIKLRGVAVVAASVIALAACGGGSNTNNATPATINATSAPTLAGAVFGAGGQGTDNSSMATGIVTSGSQPGVSTIVKHVLDISTALANQQHTGTTLAAGAAGSTPSKTSGCNGIGTDTETVTLNSLSSQTLPTTANATVSDTYSNYQDPNTCSGPIYNGSSSITGTYEVFYDASSNVAIAPLSVSISFTNLSTQQNSDTVTISGNFGYDFTWSDLTYYTTYSNATFTMSANYTDSNYPGDTFTANNFAVSFDGSSDILSVSGTLGDTNYGTVTVSSSPNPLTYATCGTGSGILDSGDTLTLTGANGSSATLNFVNDGQCAAGTNGADYGYTISWSDGAGNPGGPTATQPY